MSADQCEAHGERLSKLEEAINGNGSKGLKIIAATTKTEVHTLKEDITEIKASLQWLLYGIIGLGASFVLNVCATLLAAFLLTKGG